MLAGPTLAAEALLSRIDQRESGVATEADFLAFCGVDEIRSESELFQRFCWREHVRGPDGRRCGIRRR